MADDRLREIQLRGKDLVFLFMASAGLLVATFLCGVLVGRGVRAQKEPAMTPASAVSGAAADDPTAPLVPLQPLTKTAPAAPPTTPPPPTEEDLSYYSRLEGKSASPESVKPATGAARAETPTRSTSPAPRQAAVPVAAAAAPMPKPTAKTTTAPPPQKAAAAPPQKSAATSSAQKPAAASAAKPAEVAAGADPVGSGYVVKIVAYRDKAQSDALVARLVGKGYAAYVVTVAGKGAPLYSVRVGKFKARAEADAAKRRLEKEEQFKPLITR